MKRKGTTQDVHQHSGVPEREKKEKEGKIIKEIMYQNVLELKDTFYQMSPRCARDTEKRIYTTHITGNFRILGSKRRAYQFLERKTRSQK